MMEPSIGRIVHYVAYGTPGGEYAPEHRAAIITAVSGDINDPAFGDVALCVLNPTGVFFNVHVMHDEGKGNGTWHWPERTESE
jgi:hypothetical protein